MSNEANEEITTEVMEKMLEKMLQANMKMQEHTSGGRGRRGGNVKIKSLLVPVKITERRESCRLYLECEAEVVGPNDILDVLFQIEDAGFEVSWWQQKQDYSRGRR